MNKIIRNTEPEKRLKPRSKIFPHKKPKDLIVWYFILKARMISAWMASVTSSIMHY